LRASVRVWAAGIVALVADGVLSVIVLSSFHTPAGAPYPPLARPDQLHPFLPVAGGHSPRLLSAYAVIAARADQAVADDILRQLQPALVC
jgi:hypothetical protein